VNWLTSSCSHDRVSAQAGFVLKRCQRDLPQFLPQLLPDELPILVAHQRRHEGGDIVCLLPPALGFLPDQMEGRRSDRIALEQSATVAFTRRCIRRETLVFRMFQVLGEDQVECLHQHQRGWRIEGMRSPVVDVDVKHSLPPRRVLWDQCSR